MNIKKNERLNHLDSLEAESIEIEALGRLFSGMGCGDMCRRGYRSSIEGVSEEV